MASSAAEPFEPLDLPTGWTFAGLAAGLALGLPLGGSAVAPAVLQLTETIGTLWLYALQMTIVPLVVALLVIGIAAFAWYKLGGSPAGSQAGEKPPGIPPDVAAEFARRGAKTGPPPSTTNSGPYLPPQGGGAGSR